ncbi:DUF2244 domain-containing protein [Marinibacterium profundimaris]|uniref:Integral membrane protein n=1 Tax=Marinibacterium profundimaris TaxID=1679460 RepID=A0A225NL40_9RHOB|nr:DUF2244 domain-containing protein [Marinibacterium profundimaris]OWU72672.1 integral membrane protein [Marinibacterium profundimaris]
MPYRWTDNDRPESRELHLWPHQSMTPGGFVIFIGVTFALLLIPLMALIGTVLLWLLLPFLMTALAGVWFAISTNQRRARILETFTLSDETARLTRRNPRGDVQEWESNRHWARPELHIQGGPVPNYVTLRGAGREVEIGAFLSEDERKALYGELAALLRHP